MQRPQLQQQQQQPPQRRFGMAQMPKFPNFQQPHFNFSIPSGFQRNQRPKITLDVSRAFGSTLNELSNVGVGIATKYPTGYGLKAFQRTAKQIGSQPFNLSGKRIKSPKPGEKFFQKAQQISHQPFAISGGGGPGTAKYKGGPGRRKDDESLFVSKAQQIANQPFKLTIRPPSPEGSPAERFIKRAKQVSNQPFAISGSKTKIVDKEQLNLFKKKAKSIGFLATTTLFHKVLEEEIEKHGRFKSTAHAVIKTQRMFRGLREYDPTRGSNEVEIKKGTYPMLRRDVLEVLFQYMPVSELKTARLVCDFWKRFATVCIQHKSVVRLSGICPICKSEYMSDDPEIPQHEHSETISFYRFVLFIQEYPPEKHYGLPFRTFKISKLNLYFIPGLNTIPTRVFLMFLKLWADKIHELRLKAVQLSPPDALYRILDTCSRMRSITFDDVRVWLDPLTNNENAPMFKMKLNHFLQSITFCTNWIGEELLHWQMILEAYPCLEEINMIDVSKPEINHFLTALLNLPEEEEIDEVRTAGGFKKMSRRLMFLKVGGPDAPTEAERQRAPSPRLVLNMPFSVYRVSRILELEEKEQQTGFRKMAKSVSIRGVSVVENVAPATTGSRSFKSKARSFMLLGPLGRDSTALPDTPEPEQEQLITGGIRFKKFAKKMGGLPFKLGSLTPEAEEIMKGEGAAAFKKFATKVGHQPFKLLRPSSTTPGGETTGTAAGEGTTEGTAADGTEPKEGSTEAKPAAGPLSSTRFRKKAKSYMNQPFKMAPAEKPEPKPEEKKKNKKFRSQARGIINQPFTIVKPEAEQPPEQFVPKTFKSQIKKILHQPFKAKKPSLLLKFKSAAKTLSNQPFMLGAPKKQEKVLAGSRLCRINIATRRNFEDQLKIDLANDSDTEEDLSADENGYHSAGSDSDESSTDSIQERDLTVFDTYELLAEAVVRFDITHLTLRVHYTTEDASTFHIVLEACREKVHHLTLTRPPKVYFPERDLKFRQAPFETPEETIMEFPSVRSLSIAHNFVDSIDEISASFPALRKLTVNIIPTEFLVPKKTPYKSYVKTNLMITMRNGRPMPNVKILEWNITEARHPYTLKRTIVYKSNALRYMPRIFPNLSKLVVSITTAHELHVIFRSCTQLHDLVVLKNSFYRTKDSDIIGEPERPEEEEMYDIEEDEAAREANEARMVHPTRLRNEGIKQLVFLRRLALQNNNCCLTNRSIEEGFVHLRRLRSLHISLAKRISVQAIRLLKKCRFLVHVRITKDKLKNSAPPPQDDQPPDDDQQPGNGQLQLPRLPPGYPPFCVPVHNVPTNPKLGFESGTKFDKIGGKRYAIVKTTYEHNGRTYELIRKQYECRDDRDSQIWEKRFRIAERRRLMEEEKKKNQEKLKELEINGPEIVRKAEKKLYREQIDQESDYERFMVDYDDDDDDDEEGYCDEDDDQLFEELMITDEEQTSSEDGICMEADTMYEGDKEHYIDTEPKSSTGDESYCDSPSDPEYQADKDTGDETERNQNKKTEGKDGKPTEEKVDKPTECKDRKMAEDKDGKTTQENDSKQTEEDEDKRTEQKEGDQAEKASDEIQIRVQPVDTSEIAEVLQKPETSPQPEAQIPDPETANLPDATPQASPQPEDKPDSDPSRRDAILELLNLKTGKSKGKRKQKEKRKKSSKVHPVAEEQQRKEAKPDSASSTTGISGPFRQVYSAGEYQTSTSDASVSIRSSRRPSSTSSASPFVPSASTRSASSAASTGRRGHRHSITGDTYEQTSSEVYVHRRASFSASATSRSTPPAPSTRATSSTTDQLTNEKVGIEYNEQRRRMSLSSLSSHGPSHSSRGQGRHGLHHFDAHPDSNNSTDGENQRALKDKGKKKDKKEKSKRSESKTHKKGKKEKKKRSKSIDGKQRKGKSPMPNDDELKRAGSVSPSQMQLLGDLRQQLIQKMVNDVRIELKKH